MAPGTEFARDFCAGIGPLQLGVVLVFFIFFFITITPLSFVGPLTAQMILQQVTHIHTKSPSVFIQNYASL